METTEVKKATTKLYQFHEMTGLGMISYMFRHLNCNLYRQQCPDTIPSFGVK